ncbi:MAG TPA: hypothetical protein VGM93_13755 [Acidimicrobiales bacterium]
MNSARNKRALTVGAAVAILLSVSGCGSSSSSGSAAGAAAASRAIAAAGGGGGGSSGGGKTIDVCSLMPVATVAQITGEHVTTGAADSDDKVLASSGIFNCNYTGADDDPAQVDLTVTTKNGKIGFDADLQAASSVKAAGTKMISGLGDKAFSSIDGVHALFGDVEIQVSGLSLATSAVGLNSNDQVAPAEALIKAVHAKL